MSDVIIPLTDREQKIVLVKFIIHGNSPYADVPLGTRIKMLKVAVEKSGLIYDENELMIIGQQCLDVQAKLNNNLMDFIKGNKDMVIKAHQELDNGNDSLKKELGDELVDEGIKVLKKKKWYEKF
jgi:hypothetical protein